MTAQDNPTGPLCRHLYLQTHLESPLPRSRGQAATQCTLSLSVSLPALEQAVSPTMCRVLYLHDLIYSSKLASTAMLSPCFTGEKSKGLRGSFPPFQNQPCLESESGLFP